MKKLKILLNSIKARKNYFKKKILLDNKPNLLWIEPTNYCNLDCIMCPNRLIPEEKKGFMKFELFKKIIDEVKDYVSSIYLIVGGESILHPQLYDMISYVEKNGIRSLLNTSATLLDKNATSRLLESGISHITFAFDGYNKENYERIRKNANFEKTINNIQYFLKERKKLEKNQRPFTAITSLLVLGNENYTKEDVDKFYGLFSNLNVNEFIVKKPHSYGNKFKDTKAFNPITTGKHFYPCSHLWSTATILWNGKVVPCCFDLQAEYELGDINNEKLLDIWNGKKMIELREAMLNRTFLEHNKLCDGCVILWANKEFGLPSGMRAAISDAATCITGFWLEKRLIKIASLFDKQSLLKIIDVRKKSNNQGNI